MKKVLSLFIMKTMLVLALFIQSGYAVDIHPLYKKLATQRENEFYSYMQSIPETKEIKSTHEVDLVDEKLEQEIQKIILSYCKGEWKILSLVSKSWKFYSDALPTSLCPKNMYVFQLKNLKSRFKNVINWDFKNCKDLNSELYLSIGTKDPKAFNILYQKNSYLSEICWSGIATGVAGTFVLFCGKLVFLGFGMIF